MEFVTINAYFEDCFVFRELVRKGKGGNRGPWCR